MELIQDKIFLDQRNQLVEDLISLGPLDGSIKILVPFLDSTGKRVWKETKMYEKDRIDFINKCSHSTMV